MVANEQEREAALSRREADVARREADLAARQQALDDILAAAVVRDQAAEQRDGQATERDKAADLTAFLTPSGVDYGTDISLRRQAALDRMGAQEDRSAAAHDRWALTTEPDAQPGSHREGPAEPEE